MESPASRRNTRNVSSISGVRGDDTLCPYRELVTLKVALLVPITSSKLIFSSQKSRTYGDHVYKFVAIIDHFGRILLTFVVMSLYAVTIKM
jgi:hypothetical protein